MKHEKTKLAKYVIKKDDEIVEFFGNRLSYTECCVLFRVARLRTVINGYTIDSILFNKETGLELMEVNCVGEKTNITDMILSLMNLTIIEHKDLSHD